MRALSSTSTHFQFLTYAIRRSERLAAAANSPTLRRQKIKASTIAPERHNWRAVAERYYRPLIFVVEQRIPVGKRSSVIWKIGMTLRDRGATPSEVAAVIGASRAWQDKHGNNREKLLKEVVRVFR